MATTYRFRNRGGLHYEPNPNWLGKNPHDPDKFQKYPNGSIVESERELDKIYAEKFERIVEKEPRVVTDERRKDVADLIQSGLWMEEDRGFLEQLAPEDFQRILRRSTPAAAPVAVAEDKPKSSPWGEDVTDSFQRAYDEGFKVYRNVSGKHQVIRPGQRKPLNKEPLDAEKVDDWVGDYLKEK